jgi:hypothetical protein
MRLTFLGKSSDNGDSPTLYATDEGSYIVQGWKVTDEEVLSKLDIPDGEIVVEIYARLFGHLANDGVAGTVTSWAPPIVHVENNGNFIVQGVRLADDDARRQMAIPAHEDAVEVPKSAILTLLEGTACD